MARPAKPKEQELNYTTMAKELSQIVEHERPDGYKEAIITVTDPETGETNTGRTEWYYDGDRGTRVDYLIQDLMK